MRSRTKERYSTGKTRWLFSGSAEPASFGGDCLCAVRCHPDLSVFPFQVVGDSMVPTLETGDRLILNKLAEVDRFDIVVFPAPDGTDEEYVKRVIGLPGDEITYFQDELYINGEKVTEHYLEALKEGSNQTLTGDFTLFSLTGEMAVPEDMYFV
ncbi:MAG TPA: signal peptidase I, partial [Trichococcus flocculiformis]|nr:signal peptidase I [Trichococcus flocculiformis]